MNNQNLPKVAVIITCHNYGDMVGDAVQSVVEQDYPHENLRIVIIDDGSTDNSKSIIKNLIDNGRYIDTKQELWYGKIQDITAYFISNIEAHKQAYARNQGIRACWSDSDIFAILDADDKYLPRKISKSVNVILRDPDVIGMVYSDLLIQNTHTGIIMHELRQSYDRSELMKSCISSNAPLLTKHALSKCGLYDIETSPTEDYLMAIRISERFLLVHIPEPLSLYRVTGRNATITTSRERILDTHKIMRAKLQGQIPFKYE